MEMVASEQELRSISPSWRFFYLFLISGATDTNAFRTDGAIILLTNAVMALTLPSYLLGEIAWSANPKFESSRIGRSAEDYNFPYLGVFIVGVCVVAMISMVRRSLKKYYLGGNRPFFTAFRFVFVLLFAFAPLLLYLLHIHKII